MGKVGFPLRFATATLVSNQIDLPGNREIPLSNHINKRFPVYCFSQQGGEQSTRLYRGHARFPGQISSSILGRIIEAITTIHSFRRENLQVFLCHRSFQRIDVSIYR